MKIEFVNGKQHIHIADKTLFEKALDANGHFSFDLPVDTASPKYIPLNAAKALIKCACSICPENELDQCRRAIDWLMKRGNFEFSRLPMLCGFTPGPVDAFTSKAILLRRRVQATMPNLWCVIQYANYRLQFFVPGCQKDDFMFSSGQPLTIPTLHYRVKEIPFDWEFGESQFHQEDWSSQTEVKSSISAAFHVLHAEKLGT
jgi:hypothetical protein